MKTETDINTLISRAAAGDLGAFSQLIKLHETDLLAFALYRMPVYEEAVEAVQDTFVRAHQQLAEFKTGGDFGTWLRAICRYQILTRAKTYSRRKAHHENYTAQIDLLTAQHLSEQDADPEQDLLATLKTCQQQLSDANRDLLQKRYTEQLSTKAMAEQTGRTETWVTSTLHRVRSALRTCIQNQGVQK